MKFSCTLNAETEKGNSNLKTDVDGRDENGVFYYDVAKKQKIVKIHW